MRLKYICHKQAYLPGGFMRMPYIQNAMLPCAIVTLLIE